MDESIIIPSIHELIRHRALGHQWNVLNRLPSCHSIIFKGPQAPGTQIASARLSACCEIIFQTLQKTAKMATQGAQSESFWDLRYKLQDNVQNGT